MKGARKTLRSLRTAPIYPNIFVFRMACGALVAIVFAWLIYRYHIRRTKFPKNATDFLIPNSSRDRRTNSVRETFAFSDFPVESSKKNEIPSKTSAA